MKSSFTGFLDGEKIRGKKYLEKKIKQSFKKT